MIKIPTRLQNAARYLGFVIDYRGRVWIAETHDGTRLCEWKRFEDINLGDAVLAHQKKN